MANDKGMTVEAVDKRLASLEQTVAKEFFAQNNVLKKHGEDLSRIETTVNGLARTVKGLDEKFTGLDAKFTGLDAKFNGLDTKFNDLDTKFNDLDANVNGLAKRIPTKEDLSQFVTTLQENLARLPTKEDLKSALADHQKRLSSFE